eukprot:GEMP01117953.1.p1 GENE.GEMP01117953.1~~GEMP01117953.1.p1  ORF type:complete len:179 (-),score=21.49 GEMP01117953.1:7-543(-)
MIILLALVSYCAAHDLDSVAVRTPELVKRATKAASTVSLQCDVCRLAIGIFAAIYRDDISEAAEDGRLSDEMSKVCEMQVLASVLNRGRIKLTYHEDHPAITGLYRASDGAGKVYWDPDNTDDRVFQWQGLAVKTACHKVMRKEAKFLDYFRTHTSHSSVCVVAKFCDKDSEKREDEL